MSDKKLDVPDVLESFVKKSETDIDDKLPRPPQAETFRQRIVVWLFRCLLGMIGLSVVPAGTGAWAYSSKKAEINSEMKKKRTEARLRQRDLQLKLLERIIEVAKGADFNDPTSLYRLGLIAHMVNENTDVFGLQLIEAETTMKKLFGRLAPLSGLRRRISESGLLISSMLSQVKSLQTTIKNSDRDMATLRKLLQDPMLPKWQRKKLSDEYDDKERTMSIAQLKEEFYNQQLTREQNLLKYFQLELAHQSDVLKEMLQDVVALRDSIKTKSRAFRTLLEAIRREDLIGRSLYQETSVTLDILDRDYQNAVSTIDHLTEDLNGEREQLKLVRDAYAQCKKQLADQCAKLSTATKPTANNTALPFDDDDFDVVFVPISAAISSETKEPARPTDGGSAMSATPARPVARAVPMAPPMTAPAMAAPMNTTPMRPNAAPRPLGLKHRSPLFQRVQRKARPVLQGAFE